MFYTFILEKMKFFFIKIIFGLNFFLIKFCFYNICKYKYENIKKKLFKVY